jgi:hypothetical protein
MVQEMVESDKANLVNEMKTEQEIMNKIELLKKRKAYLKGKYWLERSDLINKTKLKTLKWVLK